MKWAWSDSSAVRAIRVCSLVALALAALRCGSRSELWIGSAAEPIDAGQEAATDAPVVDVSVVDGADSDAPGDAPDVQDAAEEEAGDAPTTCPTVGWPEALDFVQKSGTSLVTCVAPKIDPPCPGQCGNGVIDACPIGSEECDGNVGGATCVGLGYSGGSLSCTGCRFLRAGCNDCSVGGAVLACKNSLGFGVAGFSLAAQPDLIAVAHYVDAGDGYGGSARVKFFTPQLQTVTLPGCLESQEIVGIDIVTSPDGWLIAVDTAAGIDLFTLDAQGSPLVLRRLADAHNPRFAARPGAGPLLGFEIGLAQWAALVAPDGELLWTTKLFDATYTYTVYDAVFIDDAFLLAKRLEGLSGGVYVARIELDGRVTCLTQATHSYTEYPQLAWDGAHGRLTFSDFSANLDVKHAVVDSMAAVGAITSLGGQHFNPAPVVSSGSGSVVLLGSYTGGVYTSNQLTLANLDAGGNLLSSALFVDNPGSVSGHRMVALDAQHVVAGWMRQGDYFGVSDGVELSVMKR